MIDRAINVVALGAGLHTINVPTGLVPWPAQFAQAPTWVRVTLSDRPSNKPFTFGGINYGDGRGYATPFQTGETEDYFAYPQGTVGGGPDLETDTEAIATEALVQQPGGGPITVTYHVRFNIDYANIGSRPASGGVLTVSVPAQLQGISPTVLHAPGIPDSDITHDNSHLYFLLPYMEQDSVHQIVLGWDKTVNSYVPYTLTVRADVAGDLDLSNNQSTAIVTPTRPAPIIGILIGLLTDPWGGAETTSRDTVNLAGLGTPGQTAEILLDGDPVGSSLIEPDGIFTFQLTNLTPGQHRFGARYGAITHIKSPRDSASGLATGLINVNPTLPFDPMSLTFTDSQGRKYHPPTLNIADGTSNTDLVLANSEWRDVYDARERAHRNVPNQAFKVTFEDHAH